MKIKWVPMLISFAISSVLMFGGWHFYNSYALQNPLSKLLEQTDGVVWADSSLESESVYLTLELETDASLRTVLQTIKSEGAPYIKDREIELDIVNRSSAEIDHWWSSILFDIAQAMETKQYSEIPDILHQPEQPDGLQADAEMDDTYVYIRLVHDDRAKFIMLPRVPTYLKGWSDA